MEKTQEFDDEIEIDLKEIFLVIKKKILTVIAAGLLCGCLACGFTMFVLKPVYTSTSTILVMTKETTLSSFSDLQMEGQLTNDYCELIVSRPVLEEVIENLKAHGIENILALRGDIPEGMTFPDGDRFHYAYELVQEIKKHGDFCIGAACYPEGHVEQEHKEDDIRYLKQKVDSGVDFLTTQMFFDNDIHYNFLYRIREAGITVPVLPGIMPITSAAQMKRSQELSGTVFPRRFLAILDRFGSSPEAMKQAGIAYATDQIIDLLANGVNNIHIYSMNKPEIAIAIMNNLSEIIKC